jgi:hypothetical protein
MQSAETVLDVLRERGGRGLPCTELYRQLFNPGLYLMAYGRIYAQCQEVMALLQLMRLTTRRARSIAGSGRLAREFVDATATLGFRVEGDDGHRAGLLVTLDGRRLDFPLGPG